MKSRLTSLFCTSSRATRLGLFAVGLVLILSWFHPVWIFNLFLVARVVTGTLFPQLFETVSTMPADIRPTVFL